ncbi:MAG: hypothetical protein IIA61_05720 [Candidatus Marinimicrobia bacterium]|nr:hypothetical protein [Candidatus Neomarinimicrobiota bacterium]
MFTQYLSVSLVCFVFFFITATVSFATIIYIPVDVDSIQGGINLVQDGDTVLVAPEIYQESNNFIGKDILVMSELGMDSTVIQGDSTQIFIFPYWDSKK